MYSYIIVFGIFLIVSDVNLAPICQESKKAEEIRRSLNELKEYFFEKPRHKNEVENTIQPRPIYQGRDEVKINPKDDFKIINKKIMVTDLYKSIFAALLNDLLKSDVNYYDQSSGLEQTKSNVENFIEDDNKYFDVNMDMINEEFVRKLFEYDIGEYLKHKNDS
ncbi:uncharacterized protein LOC105843564 [Hydra vulgaris]|uniref:uncharacterized protein LOC105843564 n=1 Tax=Hydra vulgaris TaxID=6087 RepID=UPI000640DB88|nr:uncharacterized protein LOC105843564 [Hydra vulgaris]XP_047133277.1 uncharacterized protein LOC105843564 [Hydra vulgaris]